MPRRLLTLLLFAALCPAGLVRAQDPQSPANDDTPTLTTDDVAPASPAGRIGVGVGGSADEIFEQLYKEFGRHTAPADVAALRARLDGGGEVGLSLRFDVGPTGDIANFRKEQGSGIEAFDAWILSDLTRQNLGQKFADYRNVRVDFGVSKARLRFAASGSAPTEERAAEIEGLVNQARAGATGGPFSGITATRQGATLSVSLSVSVASLVGPGR